MRRSWITLFALLPLPVSAEIHPGDLLASESGGGSIVNIRGGGGDFTGLPRFATGGSRCRIPPPPRGTRAGAPDTLQPRELSPSSWAGAEPRVMALYPTGQASRTMV